MAGPIARRLHALRWAHARDRPPPYPASHGQKAGSSDADGRSRAEGRAVRRGLPSGMGRAVDAGVTGEARLLGDGLENPANARALLDVAAMFGIPCLFRDTRGLEAQWDADRGGLLP